MYHAPDFRFRTLALFCASALALTSAHAVELIARASIGGRSSDLSGQTGLLENGVADNLLGGLGSGLAWAGGNIFIALPDRGPNATAWNRRWPIPARTSRACRPSRWR